MNAIAVSRQYGEQTGKQKENWEIINLSGRLRRVDALLKSVHVAWSLLPPLPDISTATGANEKPHS